MRGRCRTEIVIVVGLLMLAAGIAVGIFIFGTDRAGVDHLAPIPAAIVTGFLGFLGGRYSQSQAQADKQVSGPEPEEPKETTK